LSALYFSQLVFLLADLYTRPQLHGPLRSAQSERSFRIHAAFAKVQAIPEVPKSFAALIPAASESRRWRVGV
jgi:hypothetical protein